MPTQINIHERVIAKIKLFDLLCIYFKFVHLNLVLLNFTNWDQIKGYSPTQPFVSPKIKILLSYL